MERQLADLLAPSTDALCASAIHAATHRLHSFYVQSYHLKDALKAEAGATGVAAATVETSISNEPDLALLADLANLDRHGNLNMPPRSGHIPVVTSVEGQSLESPSGTWRLHLTVNHAGKALDGLDDCRGRRDGVAACAFRLGPYLGAVACD